MKKYILLSSCITFMLATLLSGQDTLIFKDNFDNNSNKWAEGNSDKTNLKIKDGKYSFENKEGDRANLTLYPIPINGNRDFAISFSADWKDGKESNGFGLIWGQSNGTGNSFEISANGYYSYKFNKGIVEFIIPWRPSEFINKKGTNNISVKKKGQIIEFYINDHKVNEYTFGGLLGSYVGFLVSQKQRILFDDLKITYLTQTKSQDDLPVNNEITRAGIEEYIADVDANIPVGNKINDKTFAVIIVNENYQKEVKVKYAIKDGKVFKEYCEKTLGIPTKNIHFAQDASFGNMKSEIKWISDVASAYSGEAKLLFYYAGHGMPNETDKSAYLLPVDGFSSDFETAIKLSDLYDRLSANPANRITVFLDACFSGSIRDDGMLANARGVKILPRTEALKGNMIVFSAATGNETAFPYDEKQHGLFTYFLLKKLQESKGDVDYQTLFNYINQNVKQQSIVVNQKSQTPQIITSPQVQNTWKTIKLN